MRELKIVVRIDEKKNIIGTFIDSNSFGMPKGIDKTLFLMGVYHHLFNRESANLLPQKFKVGK